MSLQNDFYILNKVESRDRVALGHVLRVPQVLVLCHVQQEASENGQEQRLVHCDKEQ
jgi:hypothetical protein